MAYRTFENEPYFKAPEINYGNRTLQMLQQAMAMRGRQQQQNKALAATYQADKLANKYTNDTNKISYLTQQLTNQAVNELKTNGVLSPQTIEAQVRHRGWNSMADAQYQMARDLEKKNHDLVWSGVVPGKNYHKTDVFDQKLKDAEYGKDGDADWFTRGDNLNKVANELGKNVVQELNLPAYVADYINQLGQASRETDTKTSSGIKTEKSQKGVFFDKNGNLGVTPEAAVTFMKTSPQVQEYYKQMVDMELIDDARKMAATKDGAWVGDLLDKDPALVIEAFRKRPELNTESKVNPGDRERNLAMKDLEDAHQVHIKNSIDYSQHDERKARGLTSELFDMQNAFNKNSFGGAGGVFINLKTGTKNIPIKIGKAFDKNSMKVTGNESSPRTIFLDTYNLLPVDRKTGKPIDISGQDVDEQIAKINSLTDEQVRNMDLKTVVHGKSWNTTELDQSRKELQKLKMTPWDTMNEPDRKRFGELEMLLSQLDQDPTSIAPEIIQSKLGVVIEDLLKPIDRGTTEAKEIQGKLGKFDITDPKKWDDDQKRIAEAWRVRQEKAKEDPYVKARNEDKTRMRALGNPSKKEPMQSDEVEQNGNIFRKDPATGKYVFVRKK